MKFRSVAWLTVVVLLQVLAFAQDCPADNAFLSGRKIANITPGRMETLAGLAASRVNPTVLWAHASGQISQIFAINTAGKSIDDYTFTRTLIDAEDIAVGPGPAPSNQYIYVADSGGFRSSIVIARFREPIVNLDPHNAGNIPFADQTYFTLKYPDGPHEARALMIDPVSNDLFLITYEDSPARVYRATQQTLVAPDPTFTLVATVPVNQATAADVSPDGAQILIRGAFNGFRWIRTPIQTIAQALAVSFHPAPILGMFEIFGESLAIAADGNGYYTTGQGQDPPLYFFERNTTRYTSGREIATLTDIAFGEVSGVAASRRNPGVLWLHNDGKRSQVFAVKATGGAPDTYEFSQSMLDFEDIAIGPGPNPNLDYVYGGDIGDNGATRSEIRIFRFPEPTGLQPSGAFAPANETIITLRYPDGAHDAEALMVDPLTGDLFIASKELTQFRLYKATQAQLNSGNVVTLTLVLTGGFGPVSAGDISRDGLRIALRHENEARLWTRAPNQSVVDALDNDSERIPVIGTPLEPNGEGISFAPNARSYYTLSEGFSPSLYSFALLPQPQFESPPQRLPNGIRITINACEGSRLRLEGSADLSHWQDKGSAFVENGDATFDVPSNEQMIFYRAHLDGP